MPIEVKQRNPITHSIKVAIATILLFVVVSIVVKLTKTTKQNDNRADSAISLNEHFSANNSSFIPTITLNVDDVSLEKYWIKALSQKVSGQSEVTVEYGRVDVLTENYAIEVDFLNKWKEGIGQALHYGEVSGKIPTLALIDEKNISETSDEHKEKLQHIEALAVKKGIRLLLLRNSNRKD